MPMGPLSECQWNSSTYCHPSTLLIFDVSRMQKAQFRWEFYWVSCKGPKQLRTNYYLSAPAKMDTANLLPLNLPGLQHCDVFLLYRFLIDTQIASKLAVALCQSRALGAGYFSQNYVLADPCQPCHPFTKLIFDFSWSLCSGMLSSKRHPFDGSFTENSNGLKQLLHQLKNKWSHAGLNRGPYGYWPYALTNWAMRPCVPSWPAAMISCKKLCRQEFKWQPNRGKELEAHRCQKQPQFLSLPPGGGEEKNYSISLSPPQEVCSRPPVVPRSGCKGAPSKLSVERKTLPGRLELPTLRLTASRSNQLS